MFVNPMTRPAKFDREGSTYSNRQRFPGGLSDCYFHRANQQLLFVQIEIGQVFFAGLRLRQRPGDRFFKSSGPASG